MGPDVKLMLTFGTLHLIAVALGAGLFVIFLRAETTEPWQPPDEDDGGGGGGNDRLPGRPKTSPSGGLPPPDPVQSPARLRGGGPPPRAPRPPGRPAGRGPPARLAPPARARAGRGAGPAAAARAALAVLVR